MPTIPAGATITAATMTLNMVSGTSTAYNAKAYQVTEEEWTSATIQWSNMPAADTLLAENISHNNKTKYQFSCTPAVRHWYDEDTTGQNENYGVVLCYQDEAINDYNAIYSADCTDATKRPSLTISYDPQKISIKEGQSCNLSAARSTGNITWSSSNTAIATVSSTGTVTGIKAGRATITASMNGTVVKEYSVYVKIIEGVFYIKNKATGYYLSTKYQCFNPGTRLIQSEKMEKTWEGLWQIWRIIYMDNGYYAIRPMHKPNMGLAYTDAVELQDIGITYSMSEIGEDALWTISYSNGGYEISNCGCPNYSICSANSQCDANVTITSTSSAPIFRWLIEPVSVSTDLILYTMDTERVVSQPRRGVAPGQSRTLEEINLTFAVSSMVTIGQVVDWKSSDESVATVNPYTGVVTGVSAGETQICGTAWVVGTPYYEYYTLVVSEIPISGSELPYEPSIWNDNNVFWYTNCYAYILNNQCDPVNNYFGYNCTDGEPRQQPGEFYNENKDDSEPWLSTAGYEYNFDILREAAVKDAIIFDRLFGTNLMFTPIEKYETCPDGTYKVALFIKPSTSDGAADYHWYRQNPDGLWSHKRGRWPVINTVDYSNNSVIMDPESAASTLGYSEIVGYFAISPWNNLYTGPVITINSTENNNAITNSVIDISQSDTN
jgi:uncharacterized protein YjdB